MKAWTLMKFLRELRKLKQRLLKGKKEMNFLVLSRHVTAHNHKLMQSTEIIVH